MSLRIGQKVTRTPVSIETLAPGGRSEFGCSLQQRPMRGTVVYIHPKGRFHVVEFENSRGDKLRESFMGVESWLSISSGERQSRRCKS
jgi:hypothetical protein